MTASAKGTLSLRRATPADRDLVFGWRNRPEIVALGSTQRTVSADEHRAWFDATLADNQRLLLLILSDDEPIGQVRFDAEGAEAEVSIYLLEPYTGQGLGVEALRRSCAVAFDELAVDRIRAYILEGNERSVAAFVRAGFTPASGGTGARPRHHLLTLSRGGADG